jgi:hypothetical protein
MPPRWGTRIVVLAAMVRYEISIVMKIFFKDKKKRDKDLVFMGLNVLGCRS